MTGNWPVEATFTSSGTTGAATSKHYIRNLREYQVNSIQGFSSHYSNIKDFCVLALLPSYLERKGSSLVYMVEQFIKASKYPQSNFFLNNLEELNKELQHNEKQGITTLLLGVSFALLDFAEQYSQRLDNTIIMETGGMKGKRKELTRKELHKILTDAFQTETIHSEYGMTELLSQGYSKGKGIFLSLIHI